MKKNSALSWVTWILVIVGALNWGLVGLGQFLGGDWNVVRMILGSWPSVEAIVYLLVGVAGLLLVFGVGCGCKNCRMGGMGGSKMPNSGM